MIRLNKVKQKSRIDNCEMSEGSLRTRISSIYFHQCVSILLTREHFYSFACLTKLECIAAVSYEKTL